jgi:hypothetical protein
MKTLLSHFLLNVDFNKLEKSTVYKKQDDPSGIYFKIKIRQTQKIFYRYESAKQFIDDSNLKNIHN